MPQPKLLLHVVEEELAESLASVLQNFQFDIQKPGDGKSWIAAMQHENPDVAITQVESFDGDDLHELQNSEFAGHTELIFVSNGKPNQFVDQAMQCGVSCHLRVPIDTDLLNDILGDLQVEFESRFQKTEAALTSDLDQFGLLVGSSPPMRKLYRVIRKAADSGSSVFLIGESGVGKELVATTLHSMSERRNGQLITLNCGAISPELIESELFGHVKGAFTGASDNRSGVFEQADGGTLFLDEITEMPVDHQVKLLRVLESGEYRKVGSDRTQIADVRVIAATNRDPQEAIRDELFREDLFFRLAQFPVRVPPLRDRGDDITGLAKHILAYRNAEEETNVELGIDALEKIATHNWPGNVRELKHAIERAYILADDVINAEQIVLESTESDGEVAVPAGLPLEEVEKQVILKTLEETGGNKKETANLLGISVKTLYNKLEKYAGEERDSAE